MSRIPGRAVGPALPAKWGRPCASRARVEGKGAIPEVGGQLGLPGLPSTLGFHSPSNLQPGFAASRFSKITTHPPPPGWSAGPSIPPYPGSHGVLFFEAELCLSWSEGVPRHRGSIAGKEEIAFAHCPGSIPSGLKQGIVLECTPLQKKENSVEAK